MSPAYALSGPSRRNGLDASETAYLTVDDWTRDVGLHVKVSPSSNLVVDRTLNTDFAQVEADDKQVNLTRFPLFFQERRVFFQERGELFEFAMGGSTVAPGPQGESVGGTSASSTSRRRHQGAPAPKTLESCDCAGRC